jgi:hypothetical protein
MSQKENDSKILTSKKTTSAKLKELSKMQGLHINITEGVDKDNLTLALKKKAQIEELERQLKELEKQYQPLRDAILNDIEAIQTSEYDNVEYTAEGQRAFKYPKNSKSGQVDEAKLEELGKQKRVLGKVFKMVRVVDEDNLIKLLQTGKITADEYRAVTLQKISPVLEIKQLSVDTEPTE